jgi:hypothetical protein
VRRRPSAYSRHFSIAPGITAISLSNDLRDAGDIAGASKILMRLCRTDLRRLDAHFHLGNLAFDRSPGDAICHYEVGFRIGELSLPEDRSVVLPWGHIDNRPFLRCMDGFGLCLCRLVRFSEAYQIFERMLWLNPSDNQGVRFLVDDIRMKREWKRARSCVYCYGRANPGAHRPPAGITVL